MTKEQEKLQIIGFNPSANEVLIKDKIGMMSWQPASKIECEFMPGKWGILRPLHIEVMVEMIYEEWPFATYHIEARKAKWHKRVANKAGL